MHKETAFASHRHYCHQALIQCFDGDTLGMPHFMITSNLSEWGYLEDQQLSEQETLKDLVGEPSSCLLSC